jgi:hypothetical protein
MAKLHGRSIVSPVKRLFAVALLLVIVAGSSARADCAFSPHTFFPDRNDRVHVRVETDGESFCDNSFREGPGYHFIDVSLVKAPPHGLVATLGDNHYAYHAAPNYRGRDQYTIRACAIVGEHKGCSTLIYDVTIH